MNVAPIDSMNTQNWPRLNVVGIPAQCNQELLIEVLVAQQLLPMQPVTMYSIIITTEPSDTAFSGGSLKVPR